MLDNLIDVRDDGSLLLNMDYFNYAAGLTMCHEDKWEQLFGIPRRKPETELTQPYMNFALAAQQVTEEVIFLLAETAKKLTGSDNLVMAGGVALNCVANGKLLRRGTFPGYLDSARSRRCRGRAWGRLCRRLYWYGNTAQGHPWPGRNARCLSWP